MNFRISMVWHCVRGRNRHRLNLLKQSNWIPLLLIGIVQVVLMAIVLTGTFFTPEFPELYYREMVETLGMEMLAFSPTCKIPWMEPHIPWRAHPHYHQFLAATRYMRRSPLPQCADGPPRIILDNSTTIYSVSPWKQNDPVKCCAHLAGSSECKLIQPEGRRIIDERGMGVDYAIVQCSLYFLLKSTTIIPFAPLNGSVERRVGFLKWRFPRTIQQVPSVLLLGVGSVSRTAFRRQLPVFANVLLHMGAHEMQGYSGVGEGALANVLAMLTGLTPEEHGPRGCGASGANSSCPFVWKKLAERGFRVMRATDCPDLELFRDAPTDYNFRPIATAAETLRHSPANGSCYTCAGQHTYLQLMLSYVEKFLERFREDDYWAMVWSRSMSQDDLAGTARADVDFTRFFVKIREKHLLDDTVLIVVSDRGTREPDFGQTYRGQMEARLPALFIVLPKWFELKYPNATKALSNNELRFITPYDLHATLLDLADPPPPGADFLEGLHAGMGKSLLTPVPERTCAEAGVPPNWCFCASVSGSTNQTDLMMDAADYFNDYVQGLLAPYGNSCLPWVLHRVLSMRQLQVPNGIVHASAAAFPHVTYLLDVIGAPDWTQYTIPMLHWLSPKKGMDHWYMHLDGIDPINATFRVGNCVDNTHMKGLCYCNVSLTDFYEYDEEDL